MADWWVLCAFMVSKVRPWWSRYPVGNARLSFGMYLLFLNNAFLYISQTTRYILVRVLYFVDDAFLHAVCHYFGETLIPGEGTSTLRNAAASATMTP
jgi:hypothetical protein